MRPTFHPILLATLITAPSLRTLDAQTRTAEPPATTRGGDVRIERLPQTMSVFWGDGNRAVLGLTLAADSQSDTGGVKITDVRSEGPAAKAGLKAGDIITEVNGISLRIRAADAEDPELAGIGQRRLQRTLAKAKAGDEVDLRVQSGGSTRAVKVKTVSPSELDGDRERVRVVGQTGMSSDRDRPAIGISVGTSNNVRDTLGLFVSSVVGKGPAESAGVVEGQRIAAVNGVDVRVPKEDIEDAGAASARVNRFVREVQKGEAGAALTLRVYDGGRYREVSVKTVRASALPPDSPDDPRIRIRERTTSTPRAFDFTIPRVQIHIDGDAMEAGRESIRRTMDELRRSMQEMGRDFQIHFGDGYESTPAPRVRLSPRRTIRIL